MPMDKDDIPKMIFIPGGGHMLFGILVMLIVFTLIDPVAGVVTAVSLFLILRGLLL